MNYDIKTARLELRPMRMEDAENLLRLHTEDRDALRFIAWRPTDIAEVRHVLFRESKTLRKRGSFLWAIQNQEDPTFVGLIHLANIRDKEGEAHFFIARPHWNRGIVSEALMAVATFAGECLGLHRLCGRCDVENVPSERVFQKTRFSALGIVPKTFRDEIRDFHTFALDLKMDRLQMLASEISLRPATNDDRPFVEDVYFQTQRWLIERLFGWRGGEAEKTKFSELYDEANSQIVMLDGLRIGWLTLVKESGAWELDGIYLSPDFQGRGVGTKVVGQIVEQANAAGTPLRLSTAKVNPARNLYGRLGFRETHEDEFKVYMERTP